MAEREETAVLAEIAGPTKQEPPPHLDSASVSEEEADESGEDEVRTVFSDPANYNVKHPLCNHWTLWFDNPGKKTSASNWSANLKELITFDSVEEFWGVYNNVVKASELPSGANYHLFKKGLKPMWEDPANERGGKWVIQFPRNKTGEEINNLWLYAMLACIGEGFMHADEICGTVVSVRKIFYRISLWTASSNNKEITESVGRQMKSFLGLNNSQQLEFQPHADSIKSSSHSKERWVL